MRASGLNDREREKERQFTREGEKGECVCGATVGEKEREVKAGRERVAKKTIIMFTINGYFI